MNGNVVDGFDIANFEQMLADVQQQPKNRMLTYNSGERTYNGQKNSGDVRVDVRSIRAPGETAKSSFFSRSNPATVATEIEEKEIPGTPPPEEYEESLYFIKGFVHEISDEHPDGGGTIAGGGTLGSSFAAPEDGQMFTHADILKMVTLAATSPGYEIALDFNADEDGQGKIYTTEYLDANDGKIRKILEKELAGTGIEFEGRNMNEVLADYRGWVAEQQVRLTATEYYANLGYKGRELDYIVDDFMAVKFNEDAEKTSYGDARASADVHNQSERAVNLVFQETRVPVEPIYERLRRMAGHHHSNEDNHTHLSFVKDDAKYGGRFICAMGAEGYHSDEGTKTIVSPTANRLNNLEHSTRLLKFHLVGHLEKGGNPEKIKDYVGIDNESIDNHTATFHVDGVMTAVYNGKDAIIVSVNGLPYAEVDWPNTTETIDPSRVKVAQIDSHGHAVVLEVGGIDALASRENRAAAGLNDFKDGVEGLAELTTVAKNAYLKAIETVKNMTELDPDRIKHIELDPAKVDLNDPAAVDAAYRSILIQEEYRAGLVEIDFEGKANQLVNQIGDHLGLSAENVSEYEFRILSQYVPAEAGETPSSWFDPDAVMHAGLIADEIGTSYAGFGSDVSSYEALDKLNAVYTARLNQESGAPQTGGTGGSEYVKGGHDHTPQ